MLAFLVSAILFILISRRSVRQWKDRCSALQAALDGMEGLFFVVDRRYRLTGFNRLFAQAVRNSSRIEASRGNSLFSLGFGIDPEQLRAGLDRALSGTPLVEEMESSGGKADYQTTYYPVEDEGGSVGGAAVLLTDMRGRKSAEQELRVSQERLNLTLNTAKVGTWEWDVENDVWTPSPSFYTILGYEPKPGPVDQAEWQEWVHPDDRELVRGRIAEARDREAESYEYEARIRGADGTYSWHRVTGFCLERGPDGKIRRMLGINKDISKKKVVEEALELNERRLRNIFEESPISIWEEDFSEVRRRIEEARAAGVVDWNDYFQPRERVEEFASLIRILDVNRATVKLLECVDKAEALLKLPDFLDVSSVDTFREELVALASGRSSFECESMLNTSRGGRVFLQLRLNIAPGHEEDWKCVLVSLVDLSARKKAERALEESEAKYRGLVEQSSEGIVLLDSEGKVLDCNPVLERILGVGRDRLIGARPEDVGRALLPRSVDSLREAWKNGQKTASFETVMESESGVFRTIEQTFFPIAIGRRRLIGGILRDVTERRAAAEAIMSSLREKELLLNEIHHRVKNNLQIICSLINLQINRPTGSSAEKRELRDMEARVRSMALAHELLYNSDDFGSVDFSAYAQQLCDYLMDAYGADRQRIRLLISVDDVDLPLDKAIPCGLIINELVVNALKHAFPGNRPGTLRVDLHRTSSQAAELTVRDDGVGPAACGDEAERRRNIGLSLVENLSRQLHGSYEQVPGEGCTARVAFPL